MNRLAFIVVGIALSISYLEPGQTTRSHKNRPPEIVSFSPSLETVVRCDEHYRGMSPCTAEEVSLKVTAFDPDGDRLRYRYEVTGGKILGKGQAVRWNLEDVANGQFQARVRVTDGKGGKSTTAIVLKVVDGPHIELLAPPCPRIEVTCPSTLDVNRRATFIARVAEGKLLSGVTYHWTVNWGEIISGQGTNKIEVEHKERWGEKLTATLSIGGLDPSCVTQASCSLALE